jgi:hypothetical protein
MPPRYFSVNVYALESYQKLCCQVAVAPWDEFRSILDAYRLFMKNYGSLPQEYIFGLKHSETAI